MGKTIPPRRACSIEPRAKDGDLLRSVMTLGGIALVLAVGLSGCTGPEGETVVGSTQDLGDSNLEALAASLGIEDPPEVDVVREVSESEWLDAQLSCLAEFGFTVGTTPDGSGIDTSSVPPAQASKGGPLAMAMYTCSARYPSAADAGGLTDENLGALYDWYVNESVPCLAAAGVDAGEYPSRETFVETYYAADGWIPYAAVEAMGLSPEEVGEREAQCPQAPPTPLW